LEWICLTKTGKILTRHDEWREIKDYRPCTLAAKELILVGIIYLFKKDNKNVQSVLLLVYHAICGQKNQYKLFVFVCNSPYD
jgi:hypothetical protein